MKFKTVIGDRSQRRSKTCLSKGAFGKRRAFPSVNLKVVPQHKRYSNGGTVMTNKAGVAYQTKGQK